MCVQEIGFAVCWFVSAYWWSEGAGNDSVSLSQFACFSLVLVSFRMWCRGCVCGWGHWQHLFHLRQHMRAAQGVDKSVLKGRAAGGWGRWPCVLWSSTCRTSVLYTTKVVCGLRVVNTWPSPVHYLVADQLCVHCGSHFNVRSSISASVFVTYWVVHPCSATT